jgi:hypothetical protein
MDASQGDDVGMLGAECRFQVFHTHPQLPSRAGSV